MKIIYIIDTSSLIEMKDKYPREVFPTLWKRMDDLYNTERLITSFEVEKEIKDEELKEWVKPKKKMFIGPDKFQIEIVKEILKKYPFLAKPEKDSPNADPWLIALAIKKNRNEQTKLFPNKYIIVTEESKTNPKRIPAVCKDYNIECINLIELFIKEGWKF